MDQPRVKIMLALYTDTGFPCGHRLERAAPLPTYQFVFDDTPEGRQKAATAAQQMNEYLAKYHVPKRKVVTT